MWDRVKNLAKGAVDHRDTIQLLLKDYFNTETVNHLSDRKLMISEDLIRNEVMHFEKAADVVKGLRCDPDGIIVELHGEKKGVAVEAQIRLNIRKLILTESTQMLVVHVAEEKRPVGANFLGKMVCWVGTAIVGNFTRYALQNCDLGEYTSYNDEEALVTVRLGELPNVRRLLEPQVRAWKDSVPLRLVGIEDAVHVNQGVELCLGVSPHLRLAQEGLSPAVGVAKEFLLSKFRRT